MAITHGGNIFEAAQDRGLPWQQILDFSASINPLGPSPAAREAILCAMDRIVHYPERSGLQLREALAADWQVPVGNLITGYRSSSGSTWIPQGSVNIAMRATVYFGLEVCSHNTGTRERCLPPSNSSSLATACPRNTNTNSPGLAATPTPKAP